MTITLTHQESEKYFHNALCNGQSEIGGYGCELDYDADDYDAAKANLTERIEKKDYPHEMFVYGNETPTVCFEDVLMQLLRDGKQLTLKDVEGDGAYTRSITLADVHERVQLTQLNHLQDMINEQDDAVTADVILQTVFLQDIIFG